MNEELNPVTASIVKALALVENGGKLTTPKAGKSGEMKSFFQFTPSTWKMYSKEVFGNELPMTPENEAAVTYTKVDKWLKDGFKPEEIASIWNSGKPDAYKKEWRGTNKYGVKFDTPAYVDKFNKYMGEAGKEQPQQSSQQPQPQPRIRQQPQKPESSQTGMLPQLRNQMKQIKQPRQI